MREVGDQSAKWPPQEPNPTVWTLANARADRLLSHHRVLCGQWSALVVSAGNAFDMIVLATATPHISNPSSEAPFISMEKGLSKVQQRQRCSSLLTFLNWKGRGVIGSHITQVL